MLAPVLALTFLVLGSSTGSGMRAPLRGLGVRQEGGSARVNDASRVLVVIAKGNTESEALGAYYVSKRKIPAVNILKVDVPSAETMPWKIYEDQLYKPVSQAIKKSPTRIDFIVLMRGIPIRFDAHYGLSIDAFLAAHSLDKPYIKKISDDEVRSAANPYYMKDEPFNSKKYYMYLVTRIDGYTFKDAKALIDRSVSAKGSNGPFLLDQAGNRNNGGYLELNEALAKSAADLTYRGFNTKLDTDPAFAAPATPLAGYCSWGSNDGAFSLDKYHALSFLPGAICETFVSTSARTLRPTTGGQSLVGDLIAQGITGIKGYVSEPYTFALARPQILFNRYTRGYTLAESFYMASPIQKWKDLVIGDPICRPYPGGKG